MKAKVIADAAYLLGAMAIIISAVADYGWVRVTCAIVGVIAISTLWVHTRNGNGNQHV